MAQDKVGATTGCDFASQYIWCGQKPGNASLQTTLGFTLAYIYHLRNIILYLITFTELPCCQATWQFSHQQDYEH